MLDTYQPVIDAVKKNGILVDKNAPGHVNHTGYGATNMGSPKATMDKCPNLKYNAVLATGYNVVDVDYAKEKGVPVSNVPVYGDNPLLKAKNCIITPHMSWGAKGSRQRIMDTTVENVKAWLRGAPQNVVNQ